MDHTPHLYVERRAAQRPACPLLSLIVPVYNEAEVLDLFLAETGSALAGQTVAVEYVFVDDGSRDASADLIGARLAAGLPGRLVGLSRNFGKEAAMTAGLQHARGDIVVVLDADLQDPPALVPQMIDAWRAGYDVVYGLRVDRSSDTAMKRGTASLFYRLFNRLAHIDMPANAGDFRLMDRRVVEALLSLPERNRFMKGLFAWVGFPSVAIPYERPPRRAGAGKWNYWKLWNFALDGFTGFTTVPLRMWLYGGALAAALALAYAAFLIVRVLAYGIDVPGYASTMTAILFFAGVQLLSIGMIGEYVARLFTEAKQRPVFLVQDVIEGAPAAEVGHTAAGHEAGDA
ncbi:glycosyltransferase family 2 protein [Polymorphum gilvum]|uniref:Glycosyl transferase, group 2 family protein n=1 Tax=Polymorphum gilvum (strain LMG 25793 / CGMCC 1.9160 / SL003B-26A1) TaxID=991905 RepID=F2J323_POLGS|nr:glycosyltransferase family 2 protein [Polymorphum gilvum]ADZ68893.1 Glycosyl transferase, group 2 family protein [Polymorphum gilvum SL003B-26A1]